MSIVQSFLNLRLRIKLLIAFGSFVLLSVVLIGIFFYTLGRIEAYEKASEEVDALNIDVLEMDAGVKYFIFEGFKTDEFQKNDRSVHLASYAEHLQQVRSHMASLNALPFDGQDSLTRSITLTLAQLDLGINNVKEAFRERGFKDYGLEGRLRETIHTVEKSPYPYDKAEMLMLRRHEKDFFLRKDTKYQAEFNKTLDAFLATLQNSTGISDEKNAIIENLGKYRSQFNEIISIEAKIGLKENDGSKGEINRELGKLRLLITELRTAIKNAGNTFKRRSITGLVTLFIIQLALGVVLAFLYADILTKAIQELQRSIQKFAGGSFPEPLVVKSTDEIGKTKTAFNQLLERMRAATQFAEAMGNGNLEARYHDQYADDILARSLIKMRDQLADAQKTQAIAHWTNAGIARLNDVLKSESKNVQDIADQILKLLVTYVNANQGALFLLDDQDKEPCLERVATYAYGKKKFMEQRIDIGQGIIGQCVLERSPVVLTQVPADYIKITSGLGEAVPRFLIVIPLKVQDRVMGVLELASFERMKDHVILFLEKISENIASLLANRKTNEHTQHLLNEATAQAQRLSAQEEEIRQNAEEMQAIQEQMEREKKALEKEVIFLKERLLLKQEDQVATAYT